MNYHPRAIESFPDTKALQDTSRGLARTKTGRIGEPITASHILGKEMSVVMALQNGLNDVISVWSKSGQEVSTSQLFRMFGAASPY